MEYFLVERERRPDCLVRLSGRLAGDLQVCLTDIPQDSRLPDYVEQEPFLVSERLKQVLELYEPDVKWKLLAVTDPKRGVCGVYFSAVELPILPCIHASTRYAESKRVKELVLNKAAMSNRSFFLVRAPRELFLVVRLDVAESMLRRDLYGFCLKRVACVWDEAGEKGADR